MIQIDARRGDALISGRACFPGMESLRKQFDVLEFLDLCVGIEAAVLHESLHTIGSLSKEPISQALLDANILIFYEHVVSDMLAVAKKMTDGARFKGMLAHLPNSFPVAKSDLYTRFYASAALMATDLYFEQEVGLPVVWPSVQLPVYMCLPEVRDEVQSAKLLQNTLADKYSDLRETMLTLRRSFDGIDYIRIPPIAFEVLESAKTSDDVPSVLLDTREKYKKVRTFFTEIDDVLQSEDHSLKEKLKQKAKLIKAIGQLFDQDMVAEVSAYAGFGKSLNDKIKIDSLADGVDVGDFRWSKIVGWLIDKGCEEWCKFRIKPLHATKKHFLKQAKSSFGKLIERHFGHTVNEEDVHKAIEYEGVVSAGLKDLSRGEDQRHA